MKTLSISSSACLPNFSQDSIFFQENALAYTASNTISLCFCVFSEPQMPMMSTAIGIENISKAFKSYTVYTRCRPSSIACIILIASVFVLVGIGRNYTIIAKLPVKHYSQNVTAVRRNLTYAVSKHLQCLDFERAMTEGLWKRRSISEAERYDIDKFFTDPYRMGPTCMVSHPSSLQRKDKRCGDVSGSGKLAPYRGLCDPKGATPCCYHGHCVHRTSSQCVCPDCYDVRQRINAEHAQWISSDKSCQPHNFTAPEACQLLKGASVHVVGDSFMRHFQTALLQLVSGDPGHGALPKRVPDCKYKTVLWSEREV
jgi:hypothetical protein